MDYLATREAEIVGNIMDYFRERILNNPQAVLAQVDGELAALYVNYGNDWTGRGVVADTVQEATIAALEGVRAECLQLLEEKRTPDS